MTTLLLWLGRLAPWVWTAGAITGSLISARAWWLIRLYEQKHGGPSGALGPYVQKTSTSRALRCLGYSIVGLMSIATLFAYGSQPQPDLPLLLQFASFVTLTVLLTVPYTEALDGYRTLRLLLDE